jgi:radical SAM superfamily enzyme YgiQ (UPF0313 family)
MQAVISTDSATIGAGVRPCDVLLINPPWISKDGNIWHGVKSAMPPLGLLSIAAFLESRGMKVAVLDVHIEKLSASELAERIRKCRPRIVGITVMTATAVAAHKVAVVAKEACPDCLVVMGGVHAEAMPDEALRNSRVDLVVRGDGEQTLWRIASGEPPQTIEGVSYRSGDAILHNPPAEVVMDLDSLPFPAYHLVPMEKYYPAIGAYKRLPAINMLMTRGCPGKCTFCNSAETTLRSRSAANIVREIEQLKKRYGIREVQFYDDTFTINKRNVFEFCRLMVERKVDVTWNAFARTDCFSDKMAKAMKEAGCHQVLFGVESGDEEMLRNIEKPIDLDRTRKAVEIARDAGLEVRAAFIFGGMGETVESMRRTVAYSLELDPDICMYNICTPYPGTKLFKWAKENGYLKTEDWTEYELSAFILNLPTVTEAEILECYKEAYRRFYMRPSVILKRALKIRNPRQLLDNIHAFFYIILRRKLGSRGEVRADWVDHKKEDFLDLDVAKPAPTFLTFEAHELLLQAQPLKVGT